MTTITSRVQESVHQVVSAALRVDARNITFTDNLFHHGEYSSLTIVEIVDEVERLFGIELPSERLVIEAFESVELISALVLQVLQNKDAPADDRPALGGPTEENR